MNFQRVPQIQDVRQRYNLLRQRHRPGFLVEEIQEESGAPHPSLAQKGEVLTVVRLLLPRVLKHVRSNGAWDTSSLLLT